MLYERFIEHGIIRKSASSCGVFRAYTVGYEIIREIETFYRDVLPDGYAERRTENAVDVRIAVMENTLDE